MDISFPQPLQCLFEPKRYKVLWGGRGAGRSWGVARALLLIGAQRQIRVLCAREFQNSITDSVHKLLTDQIYAMGLDGHYEIQQAKIVGRNGTSFSFEGIKNNTSKIKSYEGIDYCWVEEAVKVSKSSWQVLIPTIRKSGSEIWITFNPELETDYTYTRFVKQSNPERAFVVKMNYRDNPWFPEELREEMEEEKKRDYDAYLNVWEGFCIQALEGAVYAKQLRRAQEENRICTVPWDREWPVDTFWDLGRADSTAIWFAQRVAMQYRILGYFQDSLQDDVGYFLKEMQRRGYVYGTCHLPHDGKAKRLGTKRTVEEQIRNAGYDVRIVPKQSLTDGINAVKLILPNCWFDESECEDGLAALRNYRYRVIDGQLSDQPLHDWASDGADAFRYLALSMTGPKRHAGIGVGERLANAAAAIQGKAMVEVGAGRQSVASPLGWMK